MTMKLLFAAMSELDFCPWISFGVFTCCASAFVECRLPQSAAVAWRCRRHVSQEPMYWIGLTNYYQWRTGVASLLMILGLDRWALIEGQSLCLIRFRKCWLVCYFSFRQHFLPYFCLIVSCKYKNPRWWSMLFEWKHLFVHCIGSLV